MLYQLLLEDHASQDRYCWIDDRAAWTLAGPGENKSQGEAFGESGKGQGRAERCQCDCLKQCLEFSKCECVHSAHAGFCGLSQSLSELCRTASPNHVFQSLCEP